MQVDVAAQFLDSYKSVTLDSMASVFGVSVDFIDHELVDFIVTGRLPAKIDKVCLLTILKQCFCLVLLCLCSGSCHVTSHHGVHSSWAPFNKPQL